MDYGIADGDDRDSLSFVHSSRWVQVPLQLIFVLFHRHAHELAARPYASFLEQALEDGLHVALGNLQAPRDFFVRELLENEPQDLELPFVEGWASARGDAPRSSKRGE
jgi:hypothetical protein